MLGGQSYKGSPKEGQEGVPSFIFANFRFQPIGQDQKKTASRLTHAWVKFKVGWREAPPNLEFDPRNLKSAYSLTNEIGSWTLPKGLKT